MVKTNKTHNKFAFFLLSSKIADDYNNGESIYNLITESISVWEKILIKIVPITLKWLYFIPLNLPFDNLAKFYDWTLCVCSVRGTTQNGECVSSTLAMI